MSYLLDTNVVLLATRAGSKASAAIDAQFQLSSARFRPAICEVSVGELRAFARSNTWGEKRKVLLEQQINRSLVIPIASPGVHEKWAEMYSALRAAGQTVEQNDIWIAATASVAGLTVLTTDKDFRRIRATVAVSARILDIHTGIEIP